MMSSSDVDRRPLLTCTVAILAAIRLVGCARVTEDRTTGRVARGERRANVSVASGVSGAVTTLAMYPNGAAHPGANAVDIRAGAGAPVWYQLDYLPGDVSGGWIHSYVTREPGACSQWSADSPHYNGSKVVVVAYFYGADGAYRGSHRAAYQHVVPARAESLVKWNNASAPAHAWRSADVALGNGTTNGLYLGTVFGVAKPVHNGPGGLLCTDGSHLHQESDGARASSLTLGAVLAARYHDVHRFGLSTP